MGSAIGRAINAALRIRFVNMAQRRHIHPVRIGGIDDDFSNLAGFCEADRMPGLARVGRFEETDPIGVLAANIRLARPDINNARIRWRDRDGADGADRNSCDGIVGNGKPCAPEFSVFQTPPPTEPM